MPKRKVPTVVAKKAAHLMKEGKSRSQAYGEAYGMQRSHRLTKTGQYKRKRG